MGHRINLLSIRHWVYDPAYRNGGTRAFSSLVSEICISQVKSLFLPKISKDLLKGDDALIVGLGKNFDEVESIFEHFSEVRNVKIVEWDEEKVDIIERYFKNKISLGKISVFHDDARSMGFIKSESVKFVFFEGVLDLHSEWDMKRIISQCCRVLKKDGIICTPDFSYFDPHGFPLEKIYSCIYKKRN